MKNSIVRQGPVNNQGAAGSKESMPSLKETVVSSIAEIIDIFKFGREKIQEINSPAEEETKDETLEPQEPKDDILPEIKPHRLP